MHNRLNVKWELFARSTQKLQSLPACYVSEEESCHIQGDKSPSKIKTHNRHFTNSSTHIAPHPSDTLQMRKAHFVHDRCWGAAGLVSGIQALKWHQRGKEEWKQLHKRSPETLQKDTLHTTANKHLHRHTFRNQSPQMPPLSDLTKCTGAIKP